MSTRCEPGAPGAAGSIPLCIPEIRGKEWEYVRECLDTGWVSSVGSYVERFEHEIAARVGVAHGVATASGTAALHIALLLAGVQRDDEVLVSTLTFISPVNTIRYVGAWPVFIDADPSYWQMDIAKVAHFLNHECHWVNGELRNQATGRRVKAVVPVHILGHPVDMDPLLELAARYNLTIIEDATESLGARYRDRPVGHLGPLACFSFNGNKLITTGGGGMIVTDRADWAARARYLTTQAKTDPVEFVHGDIGYNYRLSNVQAAIGCAQLELLDEFVAAKRRIAGRYAAALASTPGLTPMREASWAFSTHWLSTVLVDPHVYGQDRRALMRHLASHGIQSRPLWQPAHLSPAHREGVTTDCSHAVWLNRHALSLPSSIGLTNGDQERVIDLIRSSAANPPSRS